MVDHCGHGGEITVLLNSWAAGDSSALNKAVPRIYSELRQLAEARIRNRRAGLTLDAPALVNEAYLRFTQLTPVACENRSRFFALAATIMRGILVDHVRAQRANKRGGGAQPVTLSELSADADLGSDADLLDIATALKDLGKLNQRHADIVEMRFFGGLSIEETAEAMAISPATMKRDWIVAKAWIKRRLAKR